MAADPTTPQGEVGFRDIRTLLRDVLTPEIHEVMAVVEFDSTFPYNTVGAYVGRHLDASKVKWGEIGLRKKLRCYFPLDEDEELVVKLKERDGCFVYQDNGIQFFYGRLGNGFYRASITVYRNESESVTRLVVQTKGEYLSYDAERPETVFYAVWQLVEEFLKRFETHRGQRIDASRGKLFPVRLELKLRYHERAELRVTRLIRLLGLKFPNRRRKNIRVEESCLYPGTFPLANATIVHPFWDDQEWYIKSYRVENYKAPASKLNDHPCLEIRCLWKERRDFLRDEAYRELITEDVDDARAFLNEVALMALDFERDLLPLREDSEPPLSKLDRCLVAVLNLLARSPPLRKEEVFRALRHAFDPVEVERALRTLTALRFVRTVRVKGDVKGSPGLKFLMAATPSYDSETATLLELQGEEEGSFEEGRRILTVISGELELKIVERLLEENAVTVPCLEKELKESRHRIRHALTRLVRRGILTRYKGLRREVHYMFASPDLKAKIMRVFRALGYKAKELIDPLLTTRFFEELNAASEELRKVVYRILSKFGTLLPLKLEAVLRGLQEAKSRWDELKDFLWAKIAQGVEKRGYISFRELLDAAKEVVPSSKRLGLIVEEAMDEFRDAANVLEECNGDRRRIVKTLTREGLCLVALEREDSLVRRFVVPERLRWGLRPEICVVEVRNSPHNLPGWVLRGWKEG